MSLNTNYLRDKARRSTLPILAGATAIFTIAVAVGRPPAHAALSAPDATPISDSSIAPLTSLDQAVEAVAARVTPAVVNVAVTSRQQQENTADDQGQSQDQNQGESPFEQNPFAQFFGGGQQQQAPQIEHGIGSGVIVSPDGYIVTNDHVVNGATEIRVTLHDRRTFPAKVIGTDKLTDLAVIKIDASNLPSISWGDSTKLEPGESVLAFGSPFGYFQFSVTRGIVSAVDRPNPYSDDARKPGDFIQIDAAINPGNSGGPLVNAHGQLVGINTFLISNTGAFAGAGFAIPSQTVRPVVAALIKDGVVHHGYLGVGLNDVTPDNAAFFDLKKSSGALITQVTPDSPASRAGLHNGDVIVGVNGQPVMTASDLQVSVAEDAPGTSLKLDVLRNGQPQTIALTVGEYHSPRELAEASEDNVKHGARLGISIANLTPDMRKQFGVPAQQQGVAVEQVSPASPAEDAGIASGDVILQLNRKPVESAEQFRQTLQALPANKDMLLLVWSNGGASYRVVHPVSAESGT